MLRGVGCVLVLRIVSARGQIITEAKQKQNRSKTQTRAEKSVSKKTTRSRKHPK
jgi:hypothetical protein